MKARTLVLSLCVSCTLYACCWGAPCWCPDLADSDGFVNSADFSVFASNWLKSQPGLAGDFNESNTVDANDLQHLASYWLAALECPEYYADELPYSTSFENYQWYEPDQSLDYQMGWMVASGDALVNYWWTYVPELQDYFSYQYVKIEPDTVIEKEFSGTTDDEYIRLSFIPAIGQKVTVLKGAATVGSVWFNSNGYIYVRDNGSYVNTNVYYTGVYNSCRDYFSDMYANPPLAHDYASTWTDLKFKMNWASDTYSVYWNGGGTDIANAADFGQNFDDLTAIKIECADDWSVVNALSVNSWSSDTLEIDITSPCACDSDAALKGRVPIIGTARGADFGMYDLYFCPSDLAFTSQGYIDWDNWQLLDSGTNIVNEGVLGYWDTSRIPNGYYHIAAVLFNDLGYPQGAPYDWIKLLVKTVSIGGQVVYEGPGYFPVTGDLKCNTFYHQEEPDISVPWRGQFPFELKRAYNNNRRFYAKPLRNGWTHNSQIKLIEDTRYRWNLNTTGWPVPDYDDQQLGMGDIWVQYPDGGKKLYTCKMVNVGGSFSTITYKPYHNDEGDYIERDSYVDLYTDWEFDVSYTLYLRDGTEMTFYSYGNSLDDIYSSSGGIVGWKVETGISSMADRFGNALSYQWSYDKTAVTSISDGTRTIEFDLSNGYYTQARLKVGAQVYRTVDYGWDDGNKIFTVTKKGYGVNASGVYDGGTLKQYRTRYQYDSGLNLVKVAYDDSISNPAIEVDYDEYGRVEYRSDYVAADNWLTSAFDYDFYCPDANYEDVFNLRTTEDNGFRSVTMTQDDKGNLIEQRTVTGDGSAVTDVNAFYEDCGNPLKPTDIYEYFDGKTRRAWNEYNWRGDMIEQHVFIDDSNYAATKLAYHPDYSLETKRTAWQGYNKTGQLVQKESIYGAADGTENTHGKYLVKENVLTAEDPNVWAQTSYKYLTSGLVTETTDPNGFTTFTLYDGNYYVKLVKVGTAAASSPVQRFYHDAIGQRRIEANFLGGVVLNDFDDFGRLWRVRKYSDPGVMSLTDGQFVPSRYTAMTALSTVVYGYDSNGNRTYESKEAGGSISTTYTRNRLPDQVTLDDGSYLRNYYDGRGLKMEEYRYDANSAQDWWVGHWYDDMERNIQTTWLDYDDENIVKAERRGYWGDGQKKWEDFFGYNDHPEKQTDFDYDALGRLTEYVVSPGGLDIRTTFEYDAVGNRISVIDPNGSVLNFDFDNANRRITEYFAAAPGAEAEMKKGVWYHPNNLVRDVNSYDYDGTLLAHGHYEYDARRRPAEVVQDINDTQQAVTIYDYSDSGFSEQGDSYHIRMTDAEQNVTYIKLDAFARRCKTLHPSGDYEEIVYNPDGTIDEKAVWDVNDNKHWIEYSYDGYARLTDSDYPDNGNVHYTYDGFGRKILVEDGRNAEDNIGGSQEIAYTYDVLDRPTAVTDHDGYQTSYAYMHDGQRLGIWVHEPNDRLIYDAEYTYDDAGRLEYVTEPSAGALAGQIARFQYDDNGNRDSLTYWFDGNPISGQTMTVSYDHDRDNHLRGYATSGGPAFALAKTEVDGLGRLTYGEETVTGTDGNSIAHDYSYSYDMLSRLTYSYTTNVAPTPAREYAYYYDKVGNLVHRMFNNYWPDQEHHAYYGYDRYELVSSPGTPVAWWDLNGRQTSRLDPHPEWYWREYDWDGRLRAARELNPYNITQMRYAPDGTRVYKSLSTSVDPDYYKFKYIVDAAADIPSILLVIDVNDANNPIIEKTYIHAHRAILCQHDGDALAARYFFLYDRLGSVRLLVDSAGDVQNCYYYNPYGGTTGSETDENIDNWFGFAGYYWDDFTGSYYCNARSYDLALGRFTTRDPVRGAFKEPMSLHPYLYCGNDPINRIDPTGEMIDLLWGTGEYADLRAQEAQRSQGALMYAKEVVARANFRNWIQGLRVNLIEYSGFNPGQGFQAHHIFPRQFAAQFNRILAQSGMNINNPMFGMWLEASEHYAIHGAGYNAAWEAILSDPQTALQLIENAIKLGFEFGMF